MIPQFSCRAALCRAGALVCFAFWVGASCALGDLVEMQNGDRYVGRVLSLDPGTLVVQSDVLGTVTLPRGKVAHITFGPAGTNSAKPAAASSPFRGPLARQTNTASNGVAVRQIGANTNLVQQVRQQFLGDAGPEANAKFNELMGGLMTGKLTVADIRVQAKSAADQLRSLKGEMGQSAGPELDSYLAILDKFLAESAPAGAASTNTSAALPKPQDLETRKSSQTGSED
jgi:hypothetical protein